MMKMTGGEDVDYAVLRGLPITVFGTKSSGSFVDQNPLSPAQVLGKYVAYKDLEDQCPTADTIAALHAQVTKRVITAKGRGPRRTVHIFWSMKECWSCLLKPSDAADELLRGDLGCRRIKQT